MADPADYCELCDLPLSQCIHGQPKPDPEPPRAARPPTPSTRGPRTSRTSTRSASTRSPAAASSAPRKWTQPHELVPHIIGALQDAGGTLGAEEMFAALEERVPLRHGDRETNPQGELRWRAAARRARKELIDTGVLAAAGPGVWRLA